MVLMVFMRKLILFSLTYPNFWVSQLAQWLKEKKKFTCQCKRHAVLFLGQEDPLEKETATHSNIAWEIPWIEVPRGAIVQGVAKSQT